MVSILPSRLTEAPLPVSIHSPELCHSGGSFRLTSRNLDTIPLIRWWVSVCVDAGGEAVSCLFGQGKGYRTTVAMSATNRPVLELEVAHLGLVDAAGAHQRFFASVFLRPAADAFNWLAGQLEGTRAQPYA